MNSSGKANRINIKEVVYTVLLKNTSTEYTHGDIKPFGKAMQATYTPQLASGVLYGDGMVQENLAKLIGAQLQIDVNKVPIEVKADLLGSIYENGILTEGEGDEAPEIALGYVVEETNHKKECIWLFCGKVQPFNHTATQSESNMSFSTDSLTVNFYARELDKKIKAFGDTANSDFTTEQAAAFFETVPGETRTA